MSDANRPSTTSEHDDSKDGALPSNTGELTVPVQSTLRSETIDNDEPARLDDSVVAGRIFRDMRADDDDNPPHAHPAPLGAHTPVHPATQNAGGVSTSHSEMASPHMSLGATKLCPDNDPRTQTGAEPRSIPTLTVDQPQSEQSPPTRDEAYYQLKQTRPAFIPPRHWYNFSVAEQTECWDQIHRNDLTQIERVRRELELARLQLSATVQEPTQTPRRLDTHPESKPSEQNNLEDAIRDSTKALEIAEQECRVLTQRLSDASQQFSHCWQTWQSLLRSYGGRHRTRSNNRVDSTDNH